MSKYFVEFCVINGGFVVFEMKDDLSIRAVSKPRKSSESAEQLCNKFDRDAQNGLIPMFEIGE